MRALHKMLAIALVALAVFASAPAFAQQGTTSSDVVRTWYRLTLELVRHTPTQSPPVASRALAYLGVAAFEATATGSDDLISLAGQLNELTPVPQREAGQTYDDAAVVQAAMAAAVKELFGNTGPTGQRAIGAIERKLRVEAAADVPADIVARSEAHGQAVARHILEWSASDGGAVVDNMGFPLDYKVANDPGRWSPTSLIAQQQAPLLPDWGSNRTFAMPQGTACPVPPPPAYSEEKGSEFYEEALEVYETVNNLTAEQRAIARFWSDDPMLSPTPPGHWTMIALQVLGEEAELEPTVDTLARVGIVLADAFIGCWDAKFEYDLIRPITYIHRVIDKDWQPILITPPFPEYPSGHSTQSGAVAIVLADLFGADFAFEDATHEDDGLPARAFPGFWAAAEEAAISRLYGGIHYRAAIEQGLEQGRCIGGHTNALRTRR